MASNKGGQGTPHKLPHRTPSRTLHTFTVQPVGQSRPLTFGQREMKAMHHHIAALLVFALLSLRGLAEEPAHWDVTRVWQQYAAHTYSNLNTRLNGELTPIFQALGDLGELHQCFDRDRNPEKYEAYRQLLIQAFSDAMHGDVGEAMFAGALLQITPPDVLLSMIAPELGPRCRLYGILDGRHSDLAKHIQRQAQQGYAGTANFDQDARYLKSGKMRGYTNAVNYEVIIDHMFSTDPQPAFVAMLQAEYNFLPYSTTPYGCRKDEIPAVQTLQMAYADISGYLYRTRYDMPKYPFPIPEGLEKRVRSHLYSLTQHEAWWVRLYVAHLLKSERMLRWRDILDQIGKSDDPFIHGVVESIKAENPGFIREPNQAPEDTARKLADPQR